MSSVSKDQEVELSTGKTVSVSLEVTGEYDAQYGADADGNRGVGRWLVDSHSYTVESEEELTEEETAELDEKVEEIVFEGEWDFDNAEPADDDFEREEY